MSLSQMNMVSQIFLLLFLTSVLSQSSAQIPSLEGESRVTRASSLQNKYKHVSLSNLEEAYMSTKLSKTQTSLFIGNESKNQSEIKLAKYYNIQELRELIFRLGIKYRETCKVWRLGRTIRNRTIFGIRITRNASINERRLLKPMFKFVANIHGDDMVGYALMVQLMQYLLHSDGYDDRITKMLDNIDIWIVPTINPDGLDSTLNARSDLVEGKTNYYGIDLDKDFPQKYMENWREWGAERETRSLLEFITNRTFVLSGNIQGGDMVVSYPWDYSSNKNMGYLNLTDDNDIFVNLAKHYAFYNPRMGLGKGCDGKFHPNGITNGNFWRQKRGSMQDANYILTNCFELTIYLSCEKFPPASTLPSYWDANLESMLNFIESTRQGVYGLVYDNIGDPIRDAVVKVRGRKKEVKVSENGEYWRLLEWGAYEIIASAPGFQDEYALVVLSEDKPYVQHDFILQYQGVKGSVTDSFGSVISNAVVTIRKDNIEKKIKVDDTGVYRWTVGLGNITITATAPGYSRDTRPVELCKDHPFEVQQFLLNKTKKSRFGLGGSKQWP